VPGAFIGGPGRRSLPAWAVGSRFSPTPLIRTLQLASAEPSLIISAAPSPRAERRPAIWSTATPRRSSVCGSQRTSCGGDLGRPPANPLQSHLPVHPDYGASAVRFSGGCHIQVGHEHCSYSRGIDAGCPCVTSAPAKRVVCCRRTGRGACVWGRPRAPANRPTRQLLRQLRAEGSRWRLAARGQAREDSERPVATAQRPPHAG
jgi:hypothetical protein